MKNIFNFKTVVAVAGLCAGLSTAGAMDRVQLTDQQKDSYALGALENCLIVGASRGENIVGIIQNLLLQTNARYLNDVAFANLVRDIASKVATLAANSMEAYAGAYGDDYNRCSIIQKLASAIAEGKEIFSLSLDFKNGLDQKVGTQILARSTGKIPELVKKSQERKDEGQNLTQSLPTTRRLSSSAQADVKTPARQNLLASIRKGTSLTTSTVSTATPLSSTSSTTTSTTTHVAEQPAVTPKPLQIGGQQPTDLMAAIRNAAGRVQKKSSAIASSQPTMSLQPTAPFEQPETTATMLVQHQPSTSSSSSSNPKIEFVNRLSDRFVGEYMISRDVFEALSLDILKKIDASTLPMETLYAAISFNELDILG